MNSRLFGIIVGIGLAFANIAARADSAEEDKQWSEGEVTLPAFPQNSDLVEFYVSAVTPNHFFIDARTLGVGSDGVVRYVLVVLTSGGATNISYEGIRCGTGEVKLYATGRADKTWVPARSAAWRPIENKTVNRHHAALSRDYFCPGGIAIRNAVEGREALRLGKHPQAN